ncbi:MAG: fibronectin type III domain-containing protein [Verrucomicrobia bacterium]|nr:fibronectin type III domain-containing protein [Verrucomicrobiota bacterium]
MRDYTETGPPADWHQAKVAARSSATLTGLVSGKKYAFRIRALGPNDLVSPWSDEAVCMAP